MCIRDRVYAETEMEDGVTMNEVKKKDVIKFVEKQKGKLNRVEEALAYIIEMKEFPPEGKKYDQKKLNNVRKVAQKMVGKISYMIDVVEPLLNKKIKTLLTPYFDGDDYTVSTASIVALENDVQKIYAKGKQSSKRYFMDLFFCGQRMKSNKVHWRS
eukprot:TRINITY_DN337_c0_g1_i13.p1 TRINITY_DN337_c0_g1~~TRINITY_DN337_c0_g1_i13.p1  ORF type:complete len:157 (-),score=32.40 TRINITY_DN337_c0_g1_i13:143-613(-)